MRTRIILTVLLLVATASIHAQINFFGLKRGDSPQKAEMVLGQILGSKDSDSDENAFMYSNVTCYGMEWDLIAVTFEKMSGKPCLSQVVLTKMFDNKQELSPFLLGMKSVLETKYGIPMKLDNREKGEVNLTAGDRSTYNAVTLSVSECVMFYLGLVVIYAGESNEAGL